MTEKIEPIATEGKSPDADLRERVKCIAERLCKLADAMHFEEVPAFSKGQIITLLENTSAELISSLIATQLTESSHD